MRRIILCLFAMAVIVPLPAQQPFQVTPATTYGAAEKKKKEQVAFVFWSASQKQPPLPFNPFPKLSLYDAGTNNFIYDDREVDYPALEAAMAKERAETEACIEAGPLAKNAGDGMAMMSMSGGLRLGPPLHDGTHLLLTIEGAEEGGRYDVYYSTNLTNWNYLFRTLANQTNLTILPPSDSMCFFQLGTLQDTDFDTLPDAFEVLVAQLDPTTPNNATNVPMNNAAQPFLVDVPTAIVPTEQTSLFRHITLFPDGTQFGYIVADKWQRGSNGTSIITTIPKSNPPYPVSVTNVVWGTNGEALIQGATAMPARAYAVLSHVFYAALVPPGDFGLDAADVVTTKAGLQTGGLGLSTNSNLIVVGVGAAEQVLTASGWVNGATIPSQSIQVLGQTPDENGLVWGVYPDNQLIDATPVVPSNYTNYAFGLSASKIRLRILRNGVPVTDAFSTVWVGEQISLTCETDPAGYVLSNFVWTVPGNTISNWVADESRTYYEPDYPTTNAGVAYYWLDRHQRVEVTVQATLGGITLPPARTTFEVRRPQATITAQIQNVVAVDNNWDGYALHFGWEHTSFGIKFSYSTDVGAGFSYQWVQTGSAVRRRRNAQNGSWERAGTNGLDTLYPYPKKSINNIQQEWTGDDPGTPISNHLEYSANDSFTMHLMFMPQVNGVNRIWVPLRQVNWSWGGRAILVNGNYSLADPTAPPPGSDTDSTSHPFWERNIRDYLLNYVPE